MTEVPDPAVRRAFLDERRRSHERRMDTIHAPTYDDHWGEIFPSHARFVRRFAALVRHGGLVLDAPCGTGKYWPMLREAGLAIVGADQSAGMLEVARSKDPSVPAARIGLQELPFEGAFDGVLCIDAIENVGPEDWPAVLARLRAAARPGAPLYLTVEVPIDEELRQEQASARAAGHPVVSGEAFDGIGYHYYPEEAKVRAWLEECGLETIERDEGDEYVHYLLRRTPSEASPKRAGLPTLAGRRVVLRPLSAADRPALGAILAEPEVARWWVTETVESALDELFDEEAPTFAIDLDGTVIGAIQFDEELTPDYLHAGIDIFLATAHQNRGIGSDAVRTLARYLIQTRGHHRLTIDPAASNERAIRAYSRVGFRPVGIMRRYERGPDGTWHDGLLMDLLAGELRGEDEGE